MANKYDASKRLSQVVFGPGLSIDQQNRVTEARIRSNNKVLSGIKNRLQIAMARVLSNPIPIQKSFKPQVGRIMFRDAWIGAGHPPTDLWGNRVYK